MKDNIKSLQTELEKLTPGTAAYTQKLYELTTAQNSYEASVNSSYNAVYNRLNPAVSKLGTNGVKQIGLLTEVFQAQAVILTGELPNAYKTVTDAQQELFDSTVGNALGAQEAVMMLANSMQVGLDAVFNNEEAAGKKFFKSLLMNFINAAQGAIASYTAIGIAMGVPTFGASIPASLAILAGAETALSLASAVVSRFHEGGTMGFDGSRTPLRSDERPAILRVGETVRTPEQERSLQNGGTTININFSGAYIASSRAFKEVVEKGMREIGVTDVTKYFVNQRSGIALSS
jgi:hypothetical protein